MSQNSNALPKAPGVKIIRRQDEAAWRDGYRFLDEAKQVYENERARGFAEGKDAGVGEATKLVVETASKVDAYLSTLDQQVAELVMDVVRRVLGDFDQADLVARATLHALADFKREKALRVTVHPSAEHRVREVLAQNADRQLIIQVQPDPECAAGTCLIASDFAVVEATIETQLAAISKALGIPEERVAQ